MKTRKIILLKVHFGQFCHAPSLSFKFLRELFSAPQISKMSYIGNINMITFY